MQRAEVGIDLFALLGFSSVVSNVEVADKRRRLDSSSNVESTSASIPTSSWRSAGRASG